MPAEGTRTVDPFDPPIPADTCIILPFVPMDYFAERYNILDSEGNRLQNCDDVLNMITLFGSFGSEVA